MNRETLKRKIRELKRVEAAIRFSGGGAGAYVWDRFFDLRDGPDGRGKYALSALSAMDRGAYRRAIDEYFAMVYFEYYRENGLTAIAAYDPELLARLGLPFDSDEGAVKKRFRELAKTYHPDVGGDADKFIELMQIYGKLTGR